MTKYKKAEPFCNSVIKAPNSDKPHIVKIDGLWRVSPIPWAYQIKVNEMRWLKAHNFVSVLNRPLLEQMFSKEKKNER